MNPLDDALMLLDSKPLRFAAPGACEAIDTSRRVVAERDIFRCAWVIHYRNGRVRRQYERTGDAVLQTLFSKCEHKGVRCISVYDCLTDALIVEIPVPEAAEIDILSTVSISFGERMEQARIYTYGWRDGERCLYWHCDPVHMTAWSDKRRSA